MTAQQQFIPSLRLTPLANWIRDVEVSLTLRTVSVKGEILQLPMVKVVGTEYRYVLMTRLAKTDPVGEYIHLMECLEATNDMMTITPDAGWQQVAASIPAFEKAGR